MRRTRDGARSRASIEDADDLPPPARLSGLQYDGLAVRRRTALDDPVADTDLGAPHGGGAVRRAKATRKNYRFKLVALARWYSSTPDGMCPP